MSVRRDRDQDFQKQQKTSQESQQSNENDEQNALHCFPLAANNNHLVFGRLHVLDEQKLAQKLLKHRQAGRCREVLHLVIDLLGILLTHDSYQFVCGD